MRRTVMNQINFQNKGNLCQLLVNNLVHSVLLLSVVCMTGLNGGPKKRELEGAGSLGMTTERPLESDIVEDCHRQWQAILERYAWAILRDWAFAADAVQNAFVALTRFGGDVEPDARKAWMFRVVHREAIRMRNAEIRRQDVTSQLVQESPTSYHVNPLGEIAKTEEIEDLRRKIAKLPSEQQRIVSMRIVEEKTFSEIANLLAIPVGTALSRMRLALERLKATRHDEGNSHDQ